MTTAWLVLTAALVAVGWFAAWSRLERRWRAVTVLCVPVSVVIAWHALTIPLGDPASNPPAGEYSVLGARIDVDRAVYILVDASPAPRYYVLPYSNKTADQLQKAMDGERGVIMDMQDGAEPIFGEPPVEATPPKQSETPSIRLGGPNAPSL